MAAMEELVTRKRLLGKSLPYMTELPGSKVNRPFYRYGGHIELRSIIRCPGGMSTFCLYFRALFGTFFAKVFLE